MLLLSRDLLSLVELGLTAAAGSVGKVLTQKGVVNTKKSGIFVLPARSSAWHLIHRKEHLQM